MDEIQLRLNEFLYDRKYFSARALNRLALQSGIRHDVLFKLVTGVFFLLLIFWRRAALLVNCLLLGYPLFVAVFFEQEAPCQQEMLLYWPLLAFFVALDGLLDSLPCFHVVKVVALVGIFLYPSGTTDFLKLSRENLRCFVKQWALKPDELLILERKKADERTRAIFTEGSTWTSESWLRETDDTLKHFNTGEECSLVGSPDVVSVFMRTPRMVEESISQLPTIFISTKSTHI